MTPFLPSTHTHTFLSDTAECVKATPEAYRPNGNTAAHCGLMIIFFIIIIITGDAFNAIAHDGVYFPAES